MKPIHVEASAVIDARPDTVYGIIIDYTAAHQAILPRQYFKELVVEQGGIGAGTVVRVNMVVMGNRFAYRLVLSEPQPRRVMTESDAEAGVHTTFTVEPHNGGKQARVTIATDFRASPGLAGVMERLFNPSITRRIYREELSQLNVYAALWDVHYPQREYSARSTPDAPASPEATPRLSDPEFSAVGDTPENLWGMGLASSSD